MNSGRRPWLGMWRPGYGFWFCSVAATFWDANPIHTPLFGSDPNFPALWKCSHVCDKWMVYIYTKMTSDNQLPFCKARHHMVQMDFNSKPSMFMRLHYNKYLFTYAKSRGLFFFQKKYNLQLKIPWLNHVHFKWFTLWAWVSWAIAMD